MAGLDGFTKLLLHCNGTDESTSFPDASASAHTVTANGDAETSTAQLKFGSAAYLGEAVGDFLSIPDSDDFDFGSGDFTIDFWIRPTSFDNPMTIMQQATPDGFADQSFSIFFDSYSNAIFLGLGAYNSDPWSSVAVYPSLDLNTWTHIAFVRSGDNFYSFKNGVLIATGTDYTGAIPTSDSLLYIGDSGSTTYPSPVIGSLDEIRISKGIARWTTTFTPPTSEYGEEEPPPKPELDYNASLSIADGWLIYGSDDPVPIDDTIRLLEEWSIEENPKSCSMTGTLSIADTWSIGFVAQKIKMNTDLRWLTNYVTNIKTSFDWILAKTITTDFRWLKTYTPTINTDFRWLSVGYNDVPPISPSDIQIFINSVDMVPLKEVDMQSGNIVHTIGQKSTAIFTLARKHDDLNRTHLGVTSEITNQNPVQIYIQGHLEFDGKISNLSVNSDTETVQVTCQMNEPADNRHSIDLPLPSVNEKLHLYHCLLNNVQIDNPYVDPNDVNPDYYKGVMVDLGTQITQQIDTWRDLENIFDGKGVIATAVEEGTFITKPNYSYFWSVLVKNARTGIYNGDFRYIGTSMASTTTDLWVINGASPTRQKINDNLETELGFYYVGSAPYKEVSCKNGKLIIAAKYQDREDGLYHVYDEHYDYINFAKIVAGLEYEKLKNVDGGILPVTSANIDVTFDAYYYYTVKLLTRINVTNTTVANTFKNTNGFPVSVKGISINFSTMKITLTTDNRLSKKELDEIDAQMPDDESPSYLVPESVVRVYRKFDLKTWEFV